MFLGVILTACGTASSIPPVISKKSGAVVFQTAPFPLAGQLFIARISSFIDLRRILPYQTRCIRLAFHSYFAHGAIYNHRLLDYIHANPVKLGLVNAVPVFISM